MNVRNIPEPVEAEQPAYDLDVQDLDVLSGRGRESFNHVGNIKFRAIISNYTAAYMSCASRVERANVVNSVIACVHGFGGRFLRRHQVSKKWRPMTVQRSQFKVGIALRDSAMNRNSSNSNVTKQVLKRRATSTETRLLDPASHSMTLFSENHVHRKLSDGNHLSSRQSLNNAIVVRHHQSSFLNDESEMDGKPHATTNEIMSRLQVATPAQSQLEEPDTSYTTEFESHFVQLAERASPNSARAWMESTSVPTLQHNDQLRPPHMTELSEWMYGDADQFQQLGDSILPHHVIPQVLIAAKQSTQGNAQTLGKMRTKANMHHHQDCIQFLEDIETTLGPLQPDDIKAYYEQQKYKNQAKESPFSDLIDIDNLQKLKRITHIAG